MVPVVYDSVGKETFMASIDSLAPLGLMVSFGNASGPVPPVDHQHAERRKAACIVTRPTIGDLHRRSAPTSNAVTADLFDVGEDVAPFEILVNQTFPLKRGGRRGHIARSRRGKTTGSTVLIP